MFRVDYKLKLSLILCFIFITVLSLVTYFTPTKGYEISIYESTPYVVWVLLVFSIACGISVIVNQLHTEQYKSSNFWFIGFFLLLLCRIILLYIPYIRGYFTWRGDNISHIGHLKDIILTHHIPPTNFYPVSHILLTEVLSVSNLPIEFIVNYSTAFFSAFYVISIYLLSRVTLSSRKSQILAVAASCVVLFNPYNVYLMPNGWSVNYIIIPFFCYFKSLRNTSSSKYRLLFVITLILYPFFHPFSSAMIICMFMIIGVANWLIQYKITNKLSLKHLITLSPNNIVLTESTVFIMWIFSFPVFERNISGLYNAVTIGGSSNALADMENTLNKINFNYFDFITYTFKTMGDEIIFLFLTLAGFIILLKKYDQKEKNDNLLIVIIFTFFFTLFYLVYLFNIVPGLENITALRLLRYLPIFTSIPVGFALSYLLNRNIKFSPIICISIIMIASTISVFSLFDSPYITQPNEQVTRLDMAGFEWFFNSKNASLDNARIMSPSSRFADGLFGCTHYIPIDEFQIPDHFNYTNHTHLSDSFLEDKYSVITSLDRTVYENAWNAVGRFNSEDFHKLETDCTVNKLYSNGETQVYYILIRRFHLT